MLLDYRDLMELEAVDAITAEADRLSAANMTAVAYHDNKRLREVEGQIRARVRAFNGDGVVRARSNADLRAQFDAMVAKYSAPETPVC